MRITVYPKVDPRIDPPPQWKGPRYALAEPPHGGWRGGGRRGSCRTPSPRPQLSPGQAPRAGTDWVPGGYLGPRGLLGSQIAEIPQSLRLQVGLPHKYLQNTRLSRVYCSLRKSEHWGVASCRRNFGVLIVHHIICQMAGRSFWVTQLDQYGSNFF